MKPYSSGMSFPQLGDVPSWVAAGAATCALIGAVFAYRKQSEAVAKQGEQLSLQQQQFAAQREIDHKQTEELDLRIKELKASLAKIQREAVEQRAVQAKHVSVRLGRYPPPGTGIVREEPPLELLIKNDSELPIRDLYAKWESDGTNSCPLLEAGASTSILAPKKYQHPVGFYPPSESEKNSLPDKVSVYFRDYNSFCWAVKPNGEPPVLISENILDSIRKIAKYLPNYLPE